MATPTQPLKFFIRHGSYLELSRRWYALEALPARKKTPELIDEQDEIGIELEERDQAIGQYEY